jgi:hypothetical protein
MTQSCFHDPVIGEMAHVARILDAEDYAGGWVQMANWGNTPYYPFTHSSSWTTISDITPSEEVNVPCLAAGTLKIGGMIRVRAAGTIGSAAGTATTIVGLYLNGAATGTAIATSASATPATATVQNWQAEFVINIVTVGTTGTLTCQGWIIGISATPATTLLVPTVQPANQTINTTINNGISFAASWGTGAAGNTYTTNFFAVEQFN